MRSKAHGTTETAVMNKLKWGCDWDIADRICSFNRHYAEHAGYAWGPGMTWHAECAGLSDGETITYYDSVTGKALFVAPKGRTM